MLSRIILVSIAAILLASCSFKSAGENRTPRQTPERSNAASPSGQSTPASSAANAENTNLVPMTAAECQRVETGDNVVLKSQTFSFDFAPFAGSCFVTAHNPEYDEPPMESEFAIYKDGKKIFVFPSQFNGTTFGCWVDAVSFQDLNDDKLTDVIVVGKCSAKTAPYNENMVYVNTGKGFITRKDSNYKLAEFKKAKDIVDFVQKNQQLFFK